jgi:tetratricopeptide (TPR) repeat protein
MSTSSDPLQSAIVHHRAGRLQDAARIYQQILAADPTHADALHLLGLVAHQEGDPLRAIELVQKAIALDERHPAFHNSLGDVYRATGRLADAKAAYLRAIALDPQAHEPYFNLALLHQLEGDAKAAAERCRQALWVRPDHFDALRLLAAALRAQGDLAGAVQTYQQALAIHPHDFETLLNCGTALTKTGQFDHARQQLARAQAARPESMDAQLARGDLEAAAGHWPAALEAYRKAVALDPQAAIAEMHLATGLQATGDLEAAVSHYRRAIELDPAYTMAHYNLGTALAALARPAEAAAEYQATLRLDPNFADAQLNLGAYYQELREFDRALAHYDRALELQPDSAKAHFNRGLIQLTRGDLAQGWPEFEWRAQIPGFPVRAFPWPRWNGAVDLSQTVLVHAEQGLGDTLQFVRYLPLLRERCRRAIFLSPPPLVPLLRQSGFQHVVSDERELPTVDAQIPLLSLPGVLGTTLESIPAEVPYLQADPALVDAWRQRLQGVPGFRVGICWRGRATHLGDPLRSIPLPAFQPLAAVPGATFISLQKHVGRDELVAMGGRMAIVDFGDELDPPHRAFMDTAAIMTQLDLVITVDTAIAHLAGALARPVWVALPAYNDWRWMLAREDSPWYPTMRLFRQQQPRRWDDLVQRMADALARLVEARGQAP